MKSYSLENSLRESIFREDLFLYNSSLVQLVELVDLLGHAHVVEDAVVQHEVVGRVEGGLVERVHVGAGGLELPHLAQPGQVVDGAFVVARADHLGVNSIDIKNLRPVFGPKLGPILVLYFQFYILGQFSGRLSGPNLCQLN